MVSNSRHKVILFFPLNSPGHINSSLGIADRLKREFNHRTVFLILGKMMSNCIREHGHELVLLDEANPHEDYVIEEGEDPSELDEERKRREGKTKVKFEGVYKWPQVILRNQKMIQLEPVEAFIKSCKLMEELMVGELIDNHERYVKAIESIAPDMVIVDAYYIPPCVVNLRHIPWVRLYSANPLILVRSKLPNKLRPAPNCGFRLYDKRERERMRSEEPHKWQAMLDEWSRASEKIVGALDKVGERIQEFMMEHGCERLAPGQQAHDSPHLNIYMYPKALDYDQDDDLFEYPARWFRGDSLMRSASEPAAPPTADDSQEDVTSRKAWLERLSEASAGKEHLVLFSMGSLASGDCTLMERYVEMLSHDQRRLYVVSKGVNGHRFKLNESNMVGDNYIPQTLILERADLAIVHGGNNSITECMYFGLPMVVLPVFADQLDNAQRVEDLKMGRRLDAHKCTKEQLLATVDELLADQELIMRMRSIGQTMRRGSDLAKISLMLNKLVIQKSLKEEFIEECRSKAIDEIKF